MEEYDNYLPKKDKRRQGISFRLNQISDVFEMERDYHYREMLQSLQGTLFGLHNGQNPQFLEDLADVEEWRDRSLLTLYLWRQYQIESTEASYEVEINTANEEYEEKIQLIRNRLMERLESQKKKLNEDKALLNVANDHSFSLATRGMSTRSSARQVGNNSNGGYMSSASVLAAAGTSAGIAGESSDRSPGPGIASERARTLRSRDFYDDYSGFSGGEGRHAGGYGSSRGGANGANGGTSFTRSSRYENRNNSDMDLSGRSDIEGIIYGREREGTQTRQSIKSYQGMPVTKPEDIMDDISELRTAIKNLQGNRRD